MKKILIIISLLTIIIVRQVKAQNITISVNQTYLYEQTSNTATNITSSNTNITTAGITYIRSTKTKVRLRYNFNPFNTLNNGYYNIIFTTFNEDRAVANATIQFGANLYSCDSITDLYIAYPPDPNGANQNNISAGYVSYICSNVYVTNTNYANLYFNAVVGASTTHYFYLSTVFNFIPVSNIETAIQQQTQEIINSDTASTNSKTNVDDTDYQNTHNQEQALLNNYQYDTSTINLTYDRNGATWVWNTITRLLNTNTLIFTTFISIMSIGLIKLVLGR